MPTETSYWDRFSRQTFSRRRLLQAAGVGGLGAGAIAVLGCGSGSSTPGSVDDASGLLASPVDTTKQAKRGGVLKYFNSVDPPSTDPLLAGSSGNVRNRVYQRLFVPKQGYFAPQTPGEVEPEAAEGWEISQDKLQLTIKLRPDNHYDPRPPTSGRVLDSQDVLFNFKRTLELSPRRPDIFNSVNPDASIVSFEAPDARTFVIKLAYPDAGLLANLATQNSGFFGGLLPREVESGAINIKVDPRGSGPYYLARYDQGVAMEYLLNPGYFNKTLPYIEKIEAPIVSEYATQLSQLRAGAIYTIPVKPQDILSTKLGVPDLSLYASGLISASGGRTNWGWVEANTPFRDERLRQALGYALDRDLFIEALYGVSEFTDAGLPIETRWNSTAVVSGTQGWWLDPQDKDFGPSAKYFQHDIATAKQLLSAAGFPNGIDIQAFVSDAASRENSIVIGMAEQIGVRFKLEPISNQADWNSSYSRGRGRFEGVALTGAGSAGSDPGNELYLIYNTKGSLFRGYDSTGKAGTFGGDQTIEGLTSRIRQEFDIEKRISLAHELQRYDAKTQYAALFPGGARSFDLAWPVIGNYGVFTSGQSDAHEFNWWIDETKAPLQRGG